MVVVKKKKGETDQSLISRFRREVLKKGVINELKDRSRYKSGSEKKKEKKDRLKHLDELKRKRNY